MMTTIGHNSQNMTLADAADANVQTGVLLLCKEALITAIQDRRLERGHLRVLAAMVSFMNTSRARAWPGRLQLAIMTGLKAKTISNILLELRALGYLVAEKESVPEANDRRLTVYTLGNVDHETIRRQITEWVMQLREAGGEKSPPAGNNKVPAHGEVPRPRGSPKSPPAGNNPTKVPADGEEQPEKSPPAGDSNSNKKNIDLIGDPIPEAEQATKAKRASRLKENWELPQEWRRRAKAGYGLSDAQITSEANKFRRHWLQASTKNAVKLRWDLAWEDWVERAIQFGLKPAGLRGKEQAAPQNSELDETIKQMREAEGWS